MHPGFGVAVAAAVAECSIEQVCGLLDELVQAQLVMPVRDGQAHQRRYRIHELARLDAAEWALVAEGRQGCSAARARMLDWYLRFTAAADVAVASGYPRIGPAYPRTGPVEFASSGDGLSALAGERANAVAAVCVAEEGGHDDLVWQLCETLCASYARLGPLAEWAWIQGKGVAAAERCGDGRARSQMYRQLGFALMAMGRLDGAEGLFRQAVSASRTTNFPHGEAASLAGLGLLRLHQERPRDAWELLGSAHELAQASGDRRALALIDHDMGRTLHRLGRLDEAMSRLIAARQTMRTVAEPHHEARVLASIGELHLACGRPTEALEPLRSAWSALVAQRARIQAARVARLLDAGVRAVEAGPQLSVQDLGHDR